MSLTRKEFFPNVSFSLLTEYKCLVYKERKQCKRLKSSIGTLMGHIFFKLIKTEKNPTFQARLAELCYVSNGEIIAFDIFGFVSECLKY